MLLEVFKLVEHATVGVRLLERVALLPALPEVLEVLEPLGQVRVHDFKLGERDRDAERDVGKGRFLAPEDPLATIAQVLVEPAKERPPQ